LDPYLTLGQHTKVPFRFSPEVMSMLVDAKTSVYGVPMSKREAPAASNFMHAQSSICGILTCSSLISMIFSIVILKEWQHTEKYMPFLHPDMNGTANGTATPMSAASVLEGYAPIYWMVGVGSFLWACCLGSVVVIIARFLLSSRNKEGIRFCCIVEGICAGYIGCQSLAACSSLIFMAVSVAALSATGNTWCSTAWYEQSIPPPAAASSSEFQGCLDAMFGLHKIGVIFTINLAVVLCIGLLYAAACGAGAKFAGDAKDLMEDAEDRSDDGNEDYY